MTVKIYCKQTDKLLTTLKNVSSSNTPHTVTEWCKKKKIKYNTVIFIGE